MADLLAHGRLTTADMERFQAQQLAYAASPRRRAPLHAALHFALQVPGTTTGAGAAADTAAQHAAVSPALRARLAEQFTAGVEELEELLAAGQLYDADLLARLARGRLAALLMQADSFQEWAQLALVLRRLPAWVLGREDAPASTPDRRHGEGSANPLAGAPLNWEDDLSREPTAEEIEATVAEARELLGIIEAGRTDQPGAAPAVAGPLSAAVPAPAPGRNPPPQRRRRH